MWKTPQYDWYNSGWIVVFPKLYMMNTVVSSYVLHVTLVWCVALVAWKVHMGGKRDSEGKESTIKEKNEGWPLLLAHIVTCLHFQTAYALVFQLLCNSSTIINLGTWIEDTQAYPLDVETHLHSNSNASYVTVYSSLAIACSSSSSNSTILWWG